MLRLIRRISEHDGLKFVQNLDAPMAREIALLSKLPLPLLNNFNRNNDVRAG